MMTYSLFSSNLCIYHIILVTTYVYNNYYFVATYVYEFMIDFICSNLYLICVAMYNRWCFVTTFFYMCEFFIFIQFIYKLMCIITFFYFSCAFFRLRNTTHVYDILCLWQFMYDIGFIFVTTYVHNKLWFYSNFIF